MVLAVVMVWDDSAGLVHNNVGSGCFDLSPPNRLLPGAGDSAFPDAVNAPDGWKGLLVGLSLLPNRLLPPVLPPKRSIGGGPAGVVDGLPKDESDGAGVVESAGADVVVPPVEPPPKNPLDSPGPKCDPPSEEGFWGVCEPPKPPKDGVLAPLPLPDPPKAPDALFSVVAPFDDLFSPALDVPRPEKFHPGPDDLPASPPPKKLLPVDWLVLPAPNRLLPAGFAFPKRLDVDDELVEGVGPNVNLRGSLGMAAIGREQISSMSSLE